MFVTPLLLIIIFIYFVASLENPTYMNIQYPYPVLLAGWAIFIVGMLQIILWAAFIVMNDPDKMESFKGLFRQNPEWGPKSPRVFKEWMEYKSDRLQQRREQSNNHTKLKKFFWIVLGKYN